MSSKYANYASALDVFAQAPEQDLQNEFVQSGVIGKFSLQFELGWKLLKALLAYEGDPVSATGSPRDVLKTAFQYYDCMDEDVWLRMLRDRNDAAHVYDAENAKRLVSAIIESYIPEFMRLKKFVDERYGRVLEDL